MELLMMWDKRMAAAAARIGLTYYPIDYKLTTDAQVTQVLPYVGMPNDYVHWSKGKEAEKNRNQGYGGHIYEMVLNTNPSIEYLSTTNTLPMQLHVMAHATYGHVVFFKNNKYFARNHAGVNHRSAGSGAHQDRCSGRSSRLGLGRLRVLHGRPPRAGEPCGLVADHQGSAHRPATAR
jgi:spore cortex formation protein SpoVR/YcgB (stage V sporulation)